MPDEFTIVLCPNPDCEAISYISVRKDEMDIPVMCTVCGKKFVPSEMKEQTEED